MPIMESPSYHGYDVSDYYRVKREYGTNDDFRQLVTEAHKRGIRVLVDMVINHMSDKHPYFQEALRDTSSRYRAMFRWSPSRGPNNRWGGNNWHKSPLRDEYYYGFFSTRMPDLNFEQPLALAEMNKAAAFWLRDMHADGLRMDAVKYLIEDSAHVDDTPGTHAVLAAYTAAAHRVKRDAYLIGEVFDSTGTLLTYYPDQLDGYFAFEIADILMAGVRRRDARGILAPVLRLQSRIPASRWSPFLRNHDQPRTLTELGGDVAKARAAATLLLTLPGFPFVYYGEELGMTGPKPDELIRTPMAWSASGPHAGFTTGTPWQPFATDSLKANVSVQQSDSTSLWHWYRRLIHLRSSNAALATGALVPLVSSHDGVAAYLRRDGPRVVLVMVNLSDTTARNVRVRSAGAAASDKLTPGRYTLQPLAMDGVGTARASLLTVPADGLLRDASPYAELPPMSAVIVQLNRQR
jgi:glycosidase